jgi:hypothetical protein
MHNEKLFHDLMTSLSQSSFESLQTRHIRDTPKLEKI